MTLHPAPPAIETIETAWIPMPDGRRLAARLFLPADAAANPVPAILEYLPYRRRDGTRERDDEKYRWFAANGFAGARVDIAGTGDSDGLMEDEYVEREQLDGVAVIAWLAAQPWCTGAVGMMGISWGGFNALQIAARNPPALKAIVTTCSSDDRYACDAHYLGGCLINDNFSWGGTLFNYAALPPDPAVVGEDRWRALWQERLDRLELYPALWLRHQRRDDFWKQGSVCEDYGAIKCAVLAISGWLDGYTPTVLRLLEGIEAPRKAIIGPWGHKEPHNGVPGPAIGFLQECRRWWTHWLKGEDTGVDADPDLKLWLMEPVDPAPHYRMRPGRWLGLPRWPQEAAPLRRLSFGDRTLSADAPRAPAPLLVVRSPQTAGIHGQEWCPYGQGRIAAEGAADQREDDGVSLCFDTAPLEEDFQLLGMATVRLRLGADAATAKVAVRITDVAPDGTSTYVSLGLLNLTHRNSHEQPEPLVPGDFYDVAVEMKPTAQIFARGHRLRIAVSSAYWPMAWPSPTPVTLTLDPGGCSADLPFLSGVAQMTSVAFEEPVRGEPCPVTTIEPDVETRHRTYDAATEETVFHIRSNDGRYILDEIGTELTSSRHKTYSIGRNDPTMCRSVVACHQGYRRADWNARVDSEISVTCDAENFYLSGWVKAYENDAVFAARDFEETIARDGM